MCIGVPIGESPEVVIPCRTSRAWCFDWRAEFFERRERHVANVMLSSDSRSLIILSARSSSPEISSRDLSSVQLSFWSQLDLGNTK